MDCYYRMLSYPFMDAFTTIYFWSDNGPVFRSAAWACALHGCSSPTHPLRIVQSFFAPQHGKSVCDSFFALLHRRLQAEVMAGEVLDLQTLFARLNHWTQTETEGGVPTLNFFSLFV
jgi:hypothetical protein